MQCGKVNFDSKSEAKHAANTIAKRSGRRRMRAYLCKDCGAWHLTKGDIDFKDVTTKKKDRKDDYRKHPKRALADNGAD